MPPHESSIDLTQEQLDTVKAILKSIVPNYSVWVFGSRSTGTAREFSDLDLAIITQEPLNLKVTAELSEAFSESNLPFKVDIVDWSTISEDFKKIIQAHKIKLC